MEEIVGFFYGGLLGDELVYQVSAQIFCCRRVLQIGIVLILYLLLEPEVIRGSFVGYRYLAEDVSRLCIAALSNQKPRTL